MKTIGLIGGMSWESSIEYYRIINETTKARLGGLHSAKSVMVSVDFAEIEALQHQGKWETAATHMIEAAQQLERAGADCIVLCTNTMHKLADSIQANTALPFLHIADATADRIRDARLQTIGLLGTRFTMEEAFYRDRLIQHHGLNVRVPEESDRRTIHRIIYDELCQGIIRPESKAQYLAIIDTLIEAGAEGIILGCTEIELLVTEGDCSIPLFPTSRIHAEAAVDWALSASALKD
ncbi:MULTISPECIES: aspartate/glutamate racemase family protein [unclassified Leptolyngbya]|uniref:aspartate/glutamate racemase family protein n=1 Tax=unclassified Leptolyngbya TaxID=2650499 RepID=UPI001687FF16|nr:MULTISPECIES: aspartate/glutamate racemase family protein [unclassified Leptolyngbya]MBD1910714.1 aspartate/glutamate racemase family protein [Leptolyngbya sp. FACHB-8]MBD2154311.1 aspartate/glutamate racemase family protein [Leptolyngbya sp. FACHB-16]